jgi:hypothetical protein
MKKTEGRKSRDTVPLRDMESFFKTIIRILLKTMEMEMDLYVFTNDLKYNSQCPELVFDLIKKIRKKFEVPKIGFLKICSYA